MACLISLVLWLRYNLNLLRLLLKANSSRSNTSVAGIHFRVLINFQLDSGISLILVYYCTTYYDVNNYKSFTKTLRMLDKLPFFVKLSSRKELRTFHTGYQALLPLTEEALASQFLATWFRTVNVLFRFKYSFSLYKWTKKLAICLHLSFKVRKPYDFLTP